MAEWFEDESFWKTFYSVLFPAARFEAAAEQARKALQLAGFGGKTILDLACGPGRYSVALARAGYRVTGVDLSPLLLAKAKEHADTAGVDVEWVREDMRSFVRPDAYDLVLSMFTSFGYFDNKDDDLRVLRNIHKSLSEHGACLIDVIGKELLAKHFQATSSYDLDDDTVMVERREIYDDWNRIRNQWILVKEGKATTFRFDHAIYSAQELTDHLTDAGFERVKIAGDLDGGEYGPDAKRLIAVGWK